MVESGKSGFIVPLNDVNAFSEAVSKLINDGKKREEFGLYGRNFVKDRYAKKRLIGDIESLYYRKLRKKHGRL